MMIEGLLAFVLALKEHGPQHPDCKTVKTECSRKTGCKCMPNCDHEGRRLPPAGGRAECPSYCCEEKCKCHPAGCP